MTKPKKAEVEKRRNVHIYSELWHASRSILESAQRDPRGASWKFMSSLLLTAFTFEAYLNDIGPKLLNTWNNLDRLPPMAKLDLICEIQGLRLEAGLPPRQTIEQLLGFRNTIAHGRPESLHEGPVLRDVNESLQDFVAERPLAHWERLVRDDQFAVRARQATEEILTAIHATLSEPKNPLFSFGFGNASARVKDG